MHIFQADEIHICDPCSATVHGHSTASNNHKWLRIFLLLLARWKSPFRIRKSGNVFFGKALELFETQQTFCNMNANWFRMHAYQANVEMWFFPLIRISTHTHTRFYHRLNSGHVYA